MKLNNELPISSSGDLFMLLQKHRLASRILPFSVTTTMLHDACWKYVKYSRWAAGSCENEGDLRDFEDSFIF